jgi:hypothetical protein
LQRQRRRKRVAATTNLRLELLEDRSLPSFTLGALAQVGPTDPFAACSTAGQVGTNYPNSQVEPRVAVDPTNPAHIVGVWQQDRWSNGGAQGIVAGVSFDAGLHWSEGVIPGLTVCSGGTFQRASDPWVSIGPTGTVFVSSLAVNLDATGQTLNSSILVSRSTNGGITWGPPTTVITDGPNYMDDKESITADPTNSNLVYAVWDRIKIGNSFNFGGQALFARSTDGGQSWKPASVILQSPTQASNIDNQILVLPDGTLIDALVENSSLANFSFPALDILRSKDGGKDWTRPIVGPQLNIPDLLDPDTIQPFLRAGQALPELATDPNSGNLYAAWPDISFFGSVPGFPSPFDISGIDFSMSSDGGFTWSTPIIVNQTPTNLANALDSQAFNPDIAVGANGIVAVSYSDFRFNDPNPGVPTDHWAVFGNPSGLGGLTNLANWGNELRLTATSFNMENAPLANGSLFLGDYQGLAAAGTGFEAFFAQAGTSPATASIFSRQILDPPTILAALSLGAQGMSVSTVRAPSLAWTSKVDGPKQPAIWEWPWTPAALSGSLGDSLSSGIGSGEREQIGDPPWSDPFAAWGPPF